MMLSKIFQLAPETAYTPKYPKAWKTPGACFKCGEEGHCACVWTRPHKPLQLCAMCHQEGCWTTDYPHAPQVIRASNPEAPTANLLGLTMDNWGDPGSFGLTTTISNRKPWVVITVSGCLISFLLDSWNTCSVMMEFYRPNSPSSFPIGSLTRLIKSKHYPPYPFLTSGTNLSHPLPRKGPPGQNGNLYFICFPYLLNCSLTSYSSPQTTNPLIHLFL